MTILSISEAREDLAATIEKAGVEPITISRHGKPVAVIMDFSRYEAILEAMEDIEDVLAYDEAKKDMSPAIPLDEVRKALGWL